MHRTVFKISGSHVFFHNTFTSHVSFCDWWPMGIKGRNRWKWFLIVQLNQIHFIYIGRKSQSSRLSGVRVRTTSSGLRPSIPVRKNLAYWETKYIKSIRSLAIATSVLAYFLTVYNQLLKTCNEKGVMVERKEGTVQSVDSFHQERWQHAKSRS